MLSQLLSKVTVASCGFYIKCSMCPPCCWTTHSWNMLQQKSSCFLWNDFKTNANYNGCQENFGFRLPSEL